LEEYEQGNTVPLLVKNNTLYATAIPGYIYGGLNGRYHMDGRIRNVADYAISDVWIEEFAIGENLETVGEAFLYKCPDLKSIKGSSPAFVAKDSVMYNADMSTLVKFPSNHPSEEFHIPTSVTYVGDLAFEGLKNLNALYVYAKTPIGIGNGAFENTDVENIALYVPYGTKELYINDAGWGVFTNIVEMSPLYTYVTEKDGDETTFELVKDGVIDIVDSVYSVKVKDAVTMSSINYIRTFDNDCWDSWYVPFEVPYSSLENDFDVARINNIHQYDDDSDGVIDRTELEAILIKDGKLDANYPYLIRAKSAGIKTIVLDGATIFGTEANSIDCSSVTHSYTFTGTYNTLNSDDMYSIVGGIVQLCDTVSPFRWYLDIENRTVAEKPLQLSIRVIGWSDEGTTGIENAQVQDFEEGLVYDMQGYRVDAPVKGKIYILNGKKVVF
jgi:hypothetical protein